MLAKSEIEKVFTEQNQSKKVSLKPIDRLPVKTFAPAGAHIEIISGVRRCGKSTMMMQLMKDHYKNAAFFNFEDTRVLGFEASDFNKLYEVMGDNRSAYFFDEIQNVAGWEVFIRSLHDKKQKVYVTGSNASLLSKELGTRLTGRHLTHELFPFSYTEFLKYKKLRPNVKSITQYLEQGGFPEFLDSGKRDILQQLFRDVLYRDIAVRHNVKHVQTLVEIGLYLLSNVGKALSFNNIAKTFSVGSVNSISDYVSWFQDSYLLFQLPRFSWSLKNRAVNPKKNYGIDTGLIQANSLSFSEDKGRLLENAVFLHLRRSSPSIFYFRENHECDFIVEDSKKKYQALQVCYDLNSDNMTRELDGINEAMEVLKIDKGTIVTLNQDDEFIINGKKIEVVPAWKFISG